MVRRYSALVVVALLLVASRAPALEFWIWQASPGPSAGYDVDRFTDVVIVNGSRVFTGAEENLILFQSNAVLYTAVGNPGSWPMTTTDLGLTAGPGRQSCDRQDTPRRHASLWTTRA